MRYALLFCVDEELAEDAAAEASCRAWTAEMRERGVLGESLGLRPPYEATSIRVREQNALLTDGPFAETREQLAGLTVVDCADLDEALEIAAKHPAARMGVVEARPLISGH
ncbi:YciI family protein [Sciscionella marina]|uniref:YciI family protein n=1 Tax=Sciscionella marina TaxID=508770 RepID=UPI000374E681|nr:YciI family protein [Sciscionella marina]